MSNTTFIIGFGVLWLAYLVFVLVKNKKAKSKVNIEDERLNYEAHKAELLEKHFPELRRWMKDKSIDAFTAAGFPDSKANQIKEHAVDGLKKVAAATVGVKLHVQRVETAKFFVLSGEQLHFFATNIDGKLETHLIFGKERLERARITSMGAKPVLGVLTKGQKQELAQVYRLNFDIDGEALALDAYDRLDATKFEQEGMGFTRPSFYLDRAKCQVVGEGFLNALQERYPHLREEHHND